MAPSPRMALEADLRRLTLHSLAAGWLAQLLLAGLFSLLLPIPVRPLLIDRSACGPSQWRALLQRYGQLQRADRLGQQRFRPVIQASVFGEQVSPVPPAPHQLAMASPVGVREESRLSALRDRHPSALVLSCGG